MFFTIGQRVRVRPDTDAGARGWLGVVVAKAPGQEWYSVQIGTLAAQKLEEFAGAELEALPSSRGETSRPWRNERGPVVRRSHR